MSRSTILDDVEPSVLGLPAKFTSFRQAQREMVDFALYGPDGDGVTQRFCAMGAPPGIGKTAVAETMVKVSGKRTVVLTSTKSLMDQRMVDFEVADVRGRSNYDCVGVTLKDKVTGCDKPVDCELGAEWACHLEGSLACPYSAATDRAGDSASISTNYQYWMNSRGANAMALEKSGTIGLLVLDEAGLSEQELCRYLSTYLSLDDIFRFSGIAKGESQVPWKGAPEEWGRIGDAWMQVLVQMQSRARAARSDLLAGHEGNLRHARQDERFRHVDDLAKDLNKLTRHGADGNWIWQLRNKGVQFDVVWPYRYAERYLFSGVEKVVMMSATLRPKLLGLLGLKRAEVDFKEWPRQFPAVLAPVYSLPLAKLTWKSSSEDLQAMVDQIDRIIDARPGRKVLVHTHSYKRAEIVQSRSRYGRYMILNAPGRGQGLTAMQAVAKYRTMVPTPSHPAILAGPSFTTGLDFEGIDCEVNIITKVPWPDLSSPIMKARTEGAGADEGYAAYVAMQDLVQACGRGQRNEIDRCENFILDGGIDNFQHFAKQHSPAWFRIFKVKELPPAPVKL